MKNYRHGDLALIGLEKLPKGLKKSSTKILLVGNQGNHHSFDNGVFYPHIEGTFIIGYFKARKTTLLHSDHGEKVGGVRKAKIADGLYEVRKQSESTHEGLRQIVD